MMKKIKASLSAFYEHTFTSMGFYLMFKCVSNLLKQVCLHHLSLHLYCIEKRGNESQTHPISERERERSFLLLHLHVVGIKCCGRLFYDHTVCYFHVFFPLCSFL